MQDKLKQDPKVKVALDRARDAMQAADEAAQAARRAAK
jgi:hypothetical protein